MKTVTVFLLLSLVSSSLAILYITNHHYTRPYGRYHDYYGYNRGVYWPSYHRKPYYDRYGYGWNYYDYNDYGYDYWNQPIYGSYGWPYGTGYGLEHART